MVWAVLWSPSSRRGKKKRVRVSEGHVASRPEEKLLIYSVCILASSANYLVSRAECTGQRDDSGRRVEPLTFAPSLTPFTAGLSPKDTKILMAGTSDFSLPLWQLDHGVHGRKAELAVVHELTTSVAVLTVKKRAHRLDKGMSLCGFRVGWTFFIGLIPLLGDIIDALRE